jgi:hypothetical protein
MKGFEYPLTVADQLEDGAFFVFGDVSAKVVGTFRLKFTLYDLRTKETNTPGAMYLGHIFTEPFSGMPYSSGFNIVTDRPFAVVQQKDFKGLDESTYLSRAFSDQGVRLRLRKEPRSFNGNKKRTYETFSNQSSEPPYPASAVQDAYSSNRLQDSYLNHPTVNAGISPVHNPAVEPYPETPQSEHSDQKRTKLIAGQDEYSSSGHRLPWTSNYSMPPQDPHYSYTSNSSNILNMVNLGSPHQSQLAPQPPVPQSYAYYKHDSLNGSNHGNGNGNGNGV